MISAESSPNAHRAASDNRPSQQKTPSMDIRDAGLADHVGHARDSALDRMQYRILKWISPEDPPYMSGEPIKTK